MFKQPRQHSRLKLCVSGLKCLQPHWFAKVPVSILLLLLLVSVSHAQLNTVALDKPKWQVGDLWEIETTTLPIQERSGSDDVPVATLRWRFKVNDVEKVNGHSCFRIDITCLTKGRFKPKTSIWCDEKALFLRQVRTQIVFQGQYRTIEESFEPSGSGYSAVLPSLNALPLDLPAFLPKESKSDGRFVYRSQPLPSGSKDVNMLTFAHAVEQSVTSPSAKSLQAIPDKFAKSLEEGGVKEVKIKGTDKTVTQLWQDQHPWPVYSNNGRTTSRLVTVKR